MRWYEISIKTTEEAEDAISNILYELGANGVVIEDNEIVSRPNLWDYIDENQFTKKDYAKVCAYFPESSNILELTHTIEERLKETAKYINIGEGKITVSEVDEKDWAEEWKKYYKPVEIGDIVIVPSWQDYKAEDSKTIVRLDPGMAFGTGTHESTILCLEAIQKYVKPEMDVLDVGTGSGILAIAAKKFLAKRVLAVDIDEVAVKVAEENARLNGVEIEIKKNDLVEGIEEKFDVVIANIVADIIMRLSRDVKKVLKDNGIFISSGIIEDRLEDVLKSFEKNSLEIVEVKKMGTWSLVVSKKTV
ncbi:ribosomal protein L11 methyltransferase [Caldicellulosiruptor hydrothermalis 108]|uniref:Ribosomal protein L11 methyltransferase n=1 Tax=Caldicellulosiruptor hydrothermalis (strain DSM 18901 / VKM B-2411 / 108) TaxID=632292 RepID=E4Q8Y9_CALH1|nr:50S ribosomal protein L11 methyltransferase [Caldicellulosiruptor hydrothermalis]ADQ06908.1 ribosomal protein L11 methyltransferase [Caldicellulosiruptor hydrothermalis 108]